MKKTDKSKAPLPSAALLERVPAEERPALLSYFCFDAVGFGNREYDPVEGGQRTELRIAGELMRDFAAPAMTAQEKAMKKRWQKVLAQNPEEVKLLALLAIDSMRQVLAMLPPPPSIPEIQAPAIIHQGRHTMN